MEKQNQWINRIIVVVIGVVLVSAFVSNFVKTGVGKGDFAALYQDSVHAIQTGTLNDPDSLGYYPPSGRPILMLLAWLPLRIAAILWFLIAVALHSTCLYLIIRHLLPDKVENPWSLAAWIGLALTPWLAADLAGGNISPLILGSLVIAYYLFQKNRCWSAGLVLGIGISVKFLPVFLLIFFAIKRRWKMFFIGSAMTALVAILPGIVLFGPQDYVKSWKTWSNSALAKRTANSMILEGGISYVNQSWANVFLHTLGHISAGHHDKPIFVNIADLPRPTILKIWYGWMLISGLLWVYLVRPRCNETPKTLNVDFALACLPMLWFSPHVMTYYMTILMPAIAVLIWAKVTSTPAILFIKSGIAVLLTLYVLGCASVTSEYVRAYGSYQWTILILAISTVWIAHRLRQADTGLTSPALEVELPTCNINP